MHKPPSLVHHIPPRSQFSIVPLFRRDSSLLRTLLLPRSCLLGNTGHLSVLLIVLCLLLLRHIWISLCLHGGILHGLLCHRERSGLRRGSKEARGVMRGLRTHARIRGDGTLFFSIQVVHLWPPTACPRPGLTPLVGAAGWCKPYLPCYYRCYVPIPRPL